MLSSQLDLRKTTGLQKAVETALTKDVTGDGAILRNYWQMIQACKQLANPAAVLAMSTTELESLVDLILPELPSDSWPLAVQESLLRRRAMGLLVQRKYSELLMVMHPCMQSAAEASFDCKQPTLSTATGAGMRERLQLFQGVVLQSLLIPLIQKGEAAAGEVLAVCETCVQAFVMLDRVDMDLTAAQALPTYLCIWHSLIAILREPLSAQHQEPCLFSALISAPLPPKLVPA